MYYGLNAKMQQTLVNRRGKYSFPHFFKINGEYVDFDLMNLERNETDDKT